MKERQTKEAKVIKELRKLFEHGHPDFIPIMVDLMELHSKKNYDYAHGGNPLGNFYRRAYILRNYPGLDLRYPVAVALVDLLKQIDAALWQVSQNFEGKIEGVEDRLKDVAVYSVLAMIMVKEWRIEHEGLRPRVRTKR